MNQTRSPNKFPSLPPSPPPPSNFIDSTPSSILPTLPPPSAGYFDFSKIPYEICIIFLLAFPLPSNPLRPPRSRSPETLDRGQFHLAGEQCAVSISNNKTQIYMRALVSLRRKLNHREICHAGKNAPPPSPRDKIRVIVSTPTPGVL